MRTNPTSPVYYSDVVLARDDLELQTELSLRLVFQKDTFHGHAPSIGVLRFGSRLTSMVGPYGRCFLDARLVGGKNVSLMVIGAPYSVIRRYAARDRQKAFVFRGRKTSGQLTLFRNDQPFQRFGPDGSDSLRAALEGLLGGHATFKMETRSLVDALIARQHGEAIQIGIFKPDTPAEEIAAAAKDMIAKANVKEKVGGPGPGRTKTGNGKGRNPLRGAQPGRGPS